MHLRPRIIVAQAALQHPAMFRQQRQHRVFIGMEIRDTGSGLARDERKTDALCRLCTTPILTRPDIPPR